MRVTGYRTCFNKFYNDIKIYLQNNHTKLHTVKMPISLDEFERKVVIFESK